MGLIDSLSVGFGTVTRKIWLVIIPALLDIFLWQGPRLSAYPLVKRLLSFLQAPPGMSQDYLNTLGQMRELLTDMGQHFNLFSLLFATLDMLPWGLRSLMSRGLPSVGEQGNPGTLEVHSFLGFAGLFILLLLASSFIGCLFLTLLAQVVRGEDTDWLHLPQRAVSNWVRLLLLGLVGVFGLTIIALPVWLLAGLLALLSEGLAFFSITMLFMIVLWIMFYMFFAVHAIVLDEVGVFQAMGRSLMVVGRNFWSTVGLIILTNFISIGLGVIWQRLNTGSWRTLAAILGNAYIGTGLVAGTLYFYQDRCGQWLEEQHEELERGHEGHERHEEHE